MGYVVDPEKENKEITRRYKDLLKDSYQHLSEEDKKLIRKAFDLAVEAHSEQRRKTGEPYIYHPIAVAKIVASEIGLGAVSIASALLHDVVEDTDYTIEDMERLFGEKIAKIVNGLTKISRMSKDQMASIQAENFRKMLLTLNDDVRVILIKIADRLHNMQTMDAMPPLKQIKIASETLYIYAPLAHRLGLFNIKTELEDLGLKYTEPEVYDDIEKKIIANKDNQTDYIENFSSKISDALKKQGFEFEIKGRTKSIFSIRKKMRSQGVRYDEVYDKFAIRIIYDSDSENEKFDAWKIYSIVTDNYRPNPSRLRDWISQPKTTGYEALHITVMGPEGRWVEVQVRSKRMNEIAEKGYAAHFKYKQADVNESGLEGWLNRLKDTLENQSTSAVDFVEDFKLNLYSKEIYVFTPKGDIKSLPKGSSALDFAFSIHTDIGLKCRGVKVNGKLTPLDRVLSSGDQVEVMTSENQKPSERWLTFVVTARARAKIRTALKEEERRVAEEGREVLKRKLKHLKINPTDKNLGAMVSFFKLQTTFDLFYRVGIGTIGNTEIRNFANQQTSTFAKLFRRTKSNPDKVVKKEEISTNYDTLLFGNDNEKLEYTLSKCCNPIPGDKVFAFLTINEGIKIHKNNCPNAISMQSNYAYRIMKATWVDSTKQEYKVTLSIKGEDGSGMLGNITRIISVNNNMNINNLNISGDGSLFDGKFTITVTNKAKLSKVISQLNGIKGVKQVKRII
ncbi:bifunctional (p)ppGpp synthetase/guanosine-3',5'-bis(diphosphate) 3'-pyrophosphohydrolase [Wenyingzhuangia sp. 2_MG-2023]|uniref:RelA/SpoT family protein n=1 Tax=Wenyingzhuangia sp. 2_MG-2023 TaxID=3062639 RepID=UPI0026E22110|nr:RelA/SpoT family protein [Wenyingzhuangia sp. 2_MG-2023]MDO6737230.1 RelA/SpoT family protein [Wenyingzhuangia sp. 2_MG-2023]MDO6801691.1 RelA/SpoT family protein [Wenyingzhuangia sp. 1_MG-2023]